jgi:hypothetical protein
VRQPDFTEKPVVPLLTEDELAVTAKTGVNFAVTVEVGRVMPGSVRVVQVENCALANVDEKTYVFTASITEELLVE